MISYKNLRLLLTENDIKMMELIHSKIVTPTASVKINNDTGYVNLSTIDRICNYLSSRIGRTVAIEEILEYVQD